MRPFAHYGVNSDFERFASRMRWSRAGLFVLSIGCLAACTREADRDLWHRDFTRSRPTSSGEVVGYWQGDIAMGKLRAKIEGARLTLAIRCDSDGRLVAQGSVPVSVQSGDPSIMVLQSDLQSDSGDAVCGFRFYKDNRFAFALLPGGVLKINFAGTSVSELTKLADLEGAR